MARRHGVLLLVVVLLALLTTAVYADSRINVVHHFGGDALFCDAELGCWALNMGGERLWEVDQATIDAAKSAACESGMAQQIMAGAGTYGPMILEVNCDGAEGAYLKLIGYDEHGKINEMPFKSNYEPVNPPVNGASNSGSAGGKCQVDLEAYGFMSVDGIHIEEGWDVWASDENLSLVEFLYWTDSNPGLPDCDLRN